MTEDSHQDAALVYILSGSLMLSQRAEQEAGPDKVLYTAFKVSNYHYHIVILFLNKFKQIIYFRASASASLPC